MAPGANSHKDKSMRRFLISLAAAMLVAAPAAAGPRLSPEAQLAKALDGRVAGEPVNCLSLRNIRSSRIIDRTAIVYQVGNTLYVNRPRAGADSLDQWDVLVTRTFSSQLCSIEVVHLYDSSSHFQTGFVLLGDFVPYKKLR
jgi:hypothetical protein